MRRPKLSQGGDSSQSQLSTDGRRRCAGTTPLEDSRDSALCSLSLNYHHAYHHTPHTHPHAYAPPPAHAMSDSKVIHRVIRRIAGLAVVSFFSEVRVIGGERVPREGPIIA